MDRRDRVFEFLQITFGVLLISFGFYYLLAPTSLVTGGVTGLSVIFRDLFETSEFALSLFILISNILLLILGLLVIGKTFFLKTVYGSLLLPVMTAIFALLPIESTFIIDQITAGSNQLIIVSALGGVSTGLGLGLVFKNNATTGGTDVIQRILHEKLKVPYSVAIYLVDGAIILVGLFVIGFEETFFAVVAIMITGYVVDNVILSGRSGYTVFIVTTDYKTIKDAIYERLDRGVTILNVMGGYSATEKEMVVCTITRNQLYHIKAIISETDPKAFTFITKTSESLGLGFRW